MESHADDEPAPGLADSSCKDEPCADEADDDDALSCDEVFNASHCASAADSPGCRPTGGASRQQV